MKTQYFQQELKKIQELAKHFSNISPEYATQLGAEAFDPDIERLLEGFAFLTADIQEQLDADYPEFLHTLAQKICPELLLPTPSATMLTFNPRHNAAQSVLVPKGTIVDSTPTGETICHFRTCYDLLVTPLTITNIAGETIQAEHGNYIRIALTFNAGKTPLAKLDLSQLSLYISGEYNDACQLYYLLAHYIKDITIVQGKKAVAWIDPKQLKPGGFEPEQSIFTQPIYDISDFGLLKEYFIFPEKFLTFNLDLSTWNPKATGSRFILVIDCAIPTFGLPHIDKKSVVLNAIPAVNIFPHTAEPVVLEHKQENIPIRISGKEKETSQIYDIESVEGILKTTRKKRPYLAFHNWTPQQSEQPYYEMKRLSVGEEYQEHLLTVAYPTQQAIAEGEVLTTNLLCTNGRHAEQLLPGSIKIPGYGLSESLTFTNLLKPTKYYPPLHNNKVLAFLVAHLTLNQMSLSSAQHIKELINHYLPSGENNVTYKRRIDAIVDFSISLEQQLLDRYFIQGQNIFLRINGEAFQNQGELYLFGSILSQIFASSVAMNTSTRLTIENQANGEQIKWPSKLGNKALL